MAFQFRYKDTLCTPPLCFALQNIGEVARSDGGGGKYYISIVYVFEFAARLFFLDGLCGRYIQPLFYLKCVFPSLILITVVHFDVEGHMGI